MKNYYFCGPNISISSAVLRLKKAGSKCLVVTDKKKKLLGTLADSDIRYAILKKINFNKSIELIFNKKPKYLDKKDSSIENLRDIFLKYKIDILPILRKNKVIDIKFWSDAFFPKTFLSDIPVIILGGGKGKRLKPFTNILPKPLIPINDKTVIDYIIDNFKNFGISKFHFTINYKANLLKTYLNSRIKNSQFSFYKEKFSLGTLGSLSLINKKNLPDNFFVSNCDIIIKEDLKKIFDFHLKKKNHLTIVACKKSYQIPYGVLNTNKLGKIEKILEKPKKHYLINTGFYIFNKNILSTIPKNRTIDFDLFLKKNIKKNFKISTYVLDENNWLDIGTWPEYRKNSQFFV